MGDIVTHGETTVTTLQKLDINTRRSFNKQSHITPVRGSPRIFALHKLSRSAAAVTQNKGAFILHPPDQRFSTNSNIGHLQSIFTAPDNTRYPDIYRQQDFHLLVVSSGPL